MQALLSVLRTIDRRIEVVVPLFLDKVAESVVMDSPVDTGAFVTSWSITTSSGSGRSRTSDNKPRNQDPGAKRSEAFGQLQGDINTIPLNAPNIYLANRAPHAKYVNDRYAVMDLARSRMGTFLDDAVREASTIR